MFNTLKNLATSAASSFLEKDRRVSTEVLKSTFQSQVEAAGLEIASLICSDNQVAIQIKKPGAVLKATAVLDVILSEPAVDWPRRQLIFQLSSRTSLETGLLQRVVGALVISLIETVHGEHVVLEKALAGRDDIQLEGNTVKVDLRKLPGYDRLIAVPLIGSRIRLDRVYFKDDGAYVRLGMGE
ncbi:hypothetical protein SAMN05660284_00074 [Formivibrio citricus]|uniref:Uncharacterized protein n=1 Tax=Formivibrio citricus TaxID=83765 RepID=A0A1I4V101_9NEIS|nr:hypothetical protein [Formivibrio citricus]SFM94937.1 hypothetical protein SAMN05660284_00074 [Formivibrio citricus]